MSKTYSAGIVTAYGAAKRAGYQGTYEDFCRQQAGYAESAATVEQAKQTAVSASQSADQAKQDALTARDQAQTAKTQTEQAASQALTDIETARTGAISAVQTAGQSQTANARAQAQAASQSATTASTKASEASASATTATTKATEAAASATSAAQSASNAQDVLESIPADYTDLSADVEQLKDDLGDLESIASSGKNLFNKSKVESINAYIDSTLIKSNANARTVYISCEPNTTYTVSKTSATKRFVVAYSDALPTVGGTVAGTIARNNDTSITITTGNNAQYLVTWVYLSTADTLTFEQICDMLQIEVGSTATSYEPYKMYAVDEVARKEFSDFSKQAVIQSEITEPSYGAELISDFSAFTAIGSATFANGQWTMPGSSGIKITLPITAWKQYVISIGLVSTTIPDAMYAVNPLTVSVGNVSTSIFANTDGNWNIGIIPSQSGNIELSLTCSSGLSIVINSISVKQVTGYADAVMLLNNNKVYFSNHVNNTSDRKNLAMGNGHEQVSKGSSNTAFGHKSQLMMMTGYRNTAFGTYNQTNLKTGCANVAIGDNVQAVTESGMFNVGIGTAAQNKLTLGSWNNAIGNEVQRDITTGCNNTGIGRRAQSYITTGSMNTAIGSLAGFSREGHQNGDWATKTSSYQTLVGGESTQATTGTADYLTTLGFRAKGNEKAIAIGANSSATGTESIALGYGVEVSNDREIAIGSASHSIILCGKRITFNADHTVTWEDVN